MHDVDVRYIVMFTSNRLGYGFVTAALVFLLYTLTTSLHSVPRDSADKRLQEWLDIVSAPVTGPDEFPEKFTAESSEPQPHIPVHNFPIGPGHRPASYEAFLQGKPIFQDEGNTAEGPLFREVVFDFQKKGDWPQPSVDLTQFKTRRPHNLQAQRPAETFATFLCTPNTSIHDPYFAATQQLAWRFLWSPRTASKRYPFTVFVAPFIAQEHRDILAGAGANVVELDLVEWSPTVEVYTRWRDIFSKLNMWAHTNFSRIAFLDSDAFPLKNIDDIFDLAKPQRCVPAKLGAQDSLHQVEMCDYTFAGVELLDAKVNVGVMVIKPNIWMHERLLRDMKTPDLFNHAEAEQGFLNWAFQKGGPFPAKMLPREYNGFFPRPEDEHVLKVVHEKLWAVNPQAPPWIAPLWANGWKEMVEFYDSPEFKRARERDDAGAVADEPWWKKLRLSGKHEG